LRRAAPLAPLPLLVDGWAHQPTRPGEDVDRKQPRCRKQVLGVVSCLGGCHVVAMPGGGAL
jgi:hypothetical protein